MTLFNLSGRAAIVTGGNGGIGFAIAKALAAAGAAVVIAGRDKNKINASVDSIVEAGGTCIGLGLDVSDPMACQSVGQDTVDRAGRCDILVNCAGINIRKLPEDLTLQDWQSIMATNLTGAFLCSQSVHAIMRDQGGGKIISVGSMYSLFGAPMVAGYAASKGGIVQLTKSLASSWAPDNIQVNSILPGWIETELTERARNEVEGLHESVLARTPAGRWGKPDDIAGAAIFLASASSDYVTGIALPVDGGYSARG